MGISEKVAYLKGLMEGMKLDTETNEGKLISEIISMLQDVAENVSDLEEVVDCISDELDCIEEDLDNIDDYLMDDDDDEYDDYDEDEPEPDEGDGLSDEEHSTRSNARPAARSSPSTRKCSTRAQRPARTAAKSWSSTWKTKSLKRISKSEYKMLPARRTRRQKSGCPV